MWWYFDCDKNFMLIYILAQFILNYSNVYKRVILTVNVADIWPPKRTNWYPNWYNLVFFNIDIIIYEYNNLLNECLTDKVRVVWRLSNLFSWIFSRSCSEKLHLQSYLEMLWSEKGYFGLLGNNIILVIILLDIIER